jgi:hypothetical protein
MSKMEAHGAMDNGAPYFSALPLGWHLQCVGCAKNFSWPSVGLRMGLLASVGSSWYRWYPAKQHVASASIFLGYAAPGVKIFDRFSSASATSG